MGPAKRRKCLCCKRFFIADARDVDRQQYCAKTDCRKASKATSQARWLAKNQDYFHGPENVARVRAWRETHPKHKNGQNVTIGAALQDDCRAVLQDDCIAQAYDFNEEFANSISTEMPGMPALPTTRSAPQNLLESQPIVLIGLIAHFFNVEQDDIAETTHRLLKLGEDILGGRAGHGTQANHLP